MITMTFLLVQETGQNSLRLLVMKSQVCFMISANLRSWIFFHIRTESITWQPETMQIFTNYLEHTLMKASMNLRFMTPLIFLHGDVYHGKKRYHHKQISYCLQDPEIIKSLITHGVTGPVNTSRMEERYKALRPVLYNTELPLRLTTLRLRLPLAMSALHICRKISHP